MKKIADAWLPKPTDFPSARAITGEPLLRDLANNCVFRLITFRRRLRGFFGGPSATFVILLIVVLLLCNICGVLLLWIVQWIPLTTKGVIERFERVTLIPRQLAEDLHQACVAPDEVARGLWGSAASRSRMTRQWALTWFFISIALLFIIGAFSSDTNEEASIGGIVAALPLTIAAWQVVLLRFAPHDVLPGLRRQMRQIREGAETRGKIGVIIGGIIGRTALLVVGSLMLIGFFTMLSLGLRLQNALLSPFFLPAILLSACFVGGGLGYARGSFIRRNRMDSFYGLCRDLKFVLDWLASEDAKQSRKD